MSRQSNSIRARVLATSSMAVIALTSAGALAPAALAQEAAAPGNDERIVVTGSRIVRRDFQANSPIVTVDSGEFESQNGLNVEAYLNKLPQFNPAAAPTVGGLLEGSNTDVQISAVRSVGIATVSLRGLGSNRNLVLVDGHRPTPINAAMVTDTNAIPSALYERVEIITGGASAVYGADAVGGVVNFILKDDFEGLEVDTQYGTTEYGDNNELRISAVGGTNFDDGRGNVSVGLEHYARGDALERQRDFFTAAWTDPYVGGDLFVYGYNGYQPFTNGPSEAAYNAIFKDRDPSTRITTSTGGPVQVRFNEDGSLFNLTTGDYRFKDVVDGHPYGYLTVYDTNRPANTPPYVFQNLKWNDQNAYVASPQTRYSTFGSLTYDITDSLKFFARSTFAESKTKTLLYPPPVSFGWEATVPYNPTTDSPFRLTDPANPSKLLDYSNASVLAAILANPAAYANPTYVAHGAANAQHPVESELALLLNSRGRQTYCLDRSAFPAGTTGLCPATLPASQVATTDPSLLGTFAGYSPNRSAGWIVELFPFDSSPNRITTNTNDVWQLETGLEGELPGDWSWEAYVSHGESSTYSIVTGNRSLERWRELVAKPDYGAKANIIGNENGASPFFGGGIVSCTTGYYDTIFHGDVPPSDDCAYAVNATLQARTQSAQNIGELNLEGPLFDLPAGELRLAGGVQYRENRAQFYPDVLESTASFTDQVVGIYPTAYLDASTSVMDYYAETLVPILADLPFIDELSLELGARYSDYDATGEGWTYKALGDWTVNDWLRLRGGYNRASRAPNLGELYLNLQQIFVQGDTPAFGDPCGARSNAPWGAAGSDAVDPIISGSDVGNKGTLAPGQTLEGAQSTYLICRAQMGQVGADWFYTQVDAGAGTGGPSNWLYQQGNPNLKPEVADTWTFGGVIQSPFKNPWLSGLSATLDWYRIEIDDAIQQYSNDYARYLCYGTVIVHNEAEALEQAKSDACGIQGTTAGTPKTGRNLANGGATTVLVEYANLATIKTAGVDVALSWNAQLADLGVEAVPGGLGVNFQATILDYYKTKQSPLDFDPEVDWKGSLGPTLSGTNPGAFEYKLFTTVNYFLDDLSASLRWRYYPEVYPAAYAKQKAIWRQNLAVARGADGRILAFNPVDGLGGLVSTVKAKDYSIFDLSGNYRLNDSVSLRFGVNNLLDTAPIRTGENTGFQYDYSKSYAENEARRRAVCDPYGGAPAAGSGPLGCANPTGYSMPISGSGQTVGGFYDVLGRSYFVGVKATF